MKKEYDFSRAKRATEISHLNRLRESQKTKVTIYLDNDVIEGFKDKALNDGSRYQTEINRALRLFLKNGGQATEDLIRRVVREEMAHAQH